MRPALGTFLPEAIHKRDVRFAVAAHFNTIAACRFSDSKLVLHFGSPFSLTEDTRETALAEQLCALVFVNSMLVGAGT